MPRTRLWLAVLAGIVLLGAGVAIGYIAFRSNDSTENTNASVRNSNAITLANNANAANTNLANENVNEAVANVNVTPEPTNTNTAPPVIPAGLTEIETPSVFVQGLVGNDVKVYDTGTLADSKYSGQRLLLFVVRPEGPYFYPLFYRFVRQADGDLVFLALQSDDPTGQLDATKFTTDTETVVASLDYSATLQGPNAREAFELDPRVNALFDDTNLKFAFSHARYGNVYTDKEPGQAYQGLSRNGFYLKAPDGTVRIYQLKVDFLTTDGAPVITWNDGTKNYAAYTFSDIGGCGALNYTSVMSPDELSIERDLVKIGVSSKGDAVYGPKDDQHQLLKDVYETRVNQEPGDYPTSYADFLKDRPLIFYVDPFNRLVKGMNDAYKPLAECGKPVIYLYPEQTTDVDVKVEPSGGFSKTEPAYNDGWRVTAHPDGTLVERTTNAVYPYLFWEGRSEAVYETPERGWVVDRAGVHGFLNEKLAKLGLNAKEIGDFEEFWEPRMGDAPYYFVTFLGNREMNQLAPLTVTPKPDTVIRVLMDFKPLEKPISVQGYEIRTPERKGFTVVEWGGVLR